MFLFRLNNRWKRNVTIIASLMLAVFSGAIIGTAYGDPIGIGLSFKVTPNFGEANKNKDTPFPDWHLMDNNFDSYYEIIGTREDDWDRAGLTVTGEVEINFERAYVSELRVKLKISTRGDDWAHCYYQITAYDGGSVYTFAVGEESGQGDVSISVDHTWIEPVEQPIEKLRIIARGEGNEYKGFLFGPHNVDVQIKFFEIQLSFKGGYSVTSKDITGKQKNTFHPTESVYISGSGYVGERSYYLYIIDDTTLSDGMNIPNRVSGTSTNVITNALGKIPTGTEAWKGPLIPGKYDIIIDVNRNGRYDEGIDAIDDDEIKVTAGFFVIPEMPLGTVTALTSTLAALVLFTKRPTIRK